MREYAHRPQDIGSYQKTQALLRSKALNVAKNKQY